MLIFLKIKPAVIPKAIAIIAEKIPYRNENLCANSNTNELIPGFSIKT